MSNASSYASNILDQFSILSIPLLTIFILAFFPSAFLSLVRLPLLPFASPPRRDPSSSSLPPCPSHCLHPLTTTSSTAQQQQQEEASQGREKMSWIQKSFTLPPRSRGCYLITSDVVSALPEIASYKVGLVHLFVQHTSCALSMNENWDEEVREDMSDALDRIVPEDGQQQHSKGVSGGGGKLYRHSAEGKDDMPAHVKSALIGSSVSIPISNGELATGTWQGIWYLEFRARKHTRSVVATIQGEKL
ncbi:hypothetical protein GJ744_005785 [Endocarpon pusillum]|uniref:Uncharacterized protein n=1 Tax=Endocarpon pusillum TaxID=364733 RepID=A0A8H7A797_9EURO|nr:hypothetical protein GJ744_005785 [Endocarpon pusillum]